jgi:uncharacterized membrane protein
MGKIFLKNWLPGGNKVTHLEGRAQNKTWISPILDGLIYFLLFIILSNFVWGGWYVRLPTMLLEFSDLKLYGGVFGLLLCLRQPAALTKFWHQFKKWGSAEEAIHRKLALVLGIPFGFLFIVHIVRHWVLKTDAWDLLFLHQALYWPWDRVPLRCDVCLDGTYFGEHLSWTLFLLTPLTSWLHWDELIFLFKPLLVVASIFLALKHGPLKKRDWIFASMLVLCIIPLRQVMVWDFREDDLAFAFSFGAVISLYQGWILRYLGFLFLILLTKEHFGFITPFLAFPILLEPRLKLTLRERYMLASVTVFLSLVWGMISLKYLAPYFNHQIASQNNFSIRFPGYGSTPNEILWNILTTPRYWFRLIDDQFATRKAFGYVFFLLAPVIYLLRLAPVWFMPIVPGVLMNILSESDSQRSYLFHYELVFLPFMIFGTWMAARKLSEKGKLNWATVLILGITFSGDWPGAQLRNLLNDSSNFRYALYLRQLKDDGSVTGADHRVLGQLSRFQNVRDIDFYLYQKHIPLDQALDSPINLDRTGLAHHGIYQASRLVLDRHIQGENQLYLALLQKTWKQVSASHDGRFVEIRTFPAF